MSELFRSRPLVYSVVANTAPGGPRRLHGQARRFVGERGRPLASRQGARWPVRSGDQYGASGSSFCQCRLLDRSIVCTDCDDYDGQRLWRWTLRPDDTLPWQTVSTPQRRPNCSSPAAAVDTRSRRHAAVRRQRRSDSIICRDEMRTNRSGKW